MFNQNSQEFDDVENIVHQNNNFEEQPKKINYLNEVRKKVLKNKLKR